MNSRTKGIFCILSSAFCFALMSSFVRLAGDLPSVQKSFFPQPDRRPDCPYPAAAGTP